MKSLEKSHEDNLPIPNGELTTALIFVVLTFELKYKMNKKTETVLLKAPGKFHIGRKCIFD